ncbi:Nucleoporin nup57 [Sporothrix eucalyptigena]|uniref:Nucleoporin nup57 n=1 Tax=Sporothrix eucalyptigena TaxID=1812306 RepID=A0ABP0CUX4_9PEZI
MSLFGAKPATGGLFGSNTTAAASPFAQTALTTAVQPATGGLFGGSTQTAQQPAATGGLFGASTQQQQQPAAATLGGLFGTSTQTAQQPQQQSQFGSSLFGTQPQQQQQQQQQQQLQLQQQQQQMQQSVNQSSLWGTSVWQPGQPVAPLEKPIPDQIATLIAKWRPDSPNTVFKEYFYNKVDENRVPFFQPQAHENPREWEEALQNKPAPGYLPVLGTGFEGLATRLQLQRRTVATFNAGLHEINTKLDAILSQHDLQTSVRALAARRRHNELSKRCLALAAKTQVLRNRGYALSGDEDDLKQKLQALEKTMQDPALSARMEELWSRLIVLRNYADALRVEVNKRGIKEDEGLGEDIEAKAKKIVEDYEKQLQHLKKEVDQINTDFDLWQKEQKFAN